MEIVVAVGGTVLLRSVLRQPSVKATIPAMAVVELTWVLFAYALVMAWWLRRRYGSLAPFGLKRISPSKAIGLGLLGTLIAVAITSLTTPLFNTWFGKVQMAKFVGIEHNLPVYLSLLPVAILFGGFGEEFIYRGILLSRLRVILGGTRGALIASVILQAVVFGGVHAYQGLGGMIGVGLTSVVCAIPYLRTGPNLWPAVAAHAIEDVLGFTLLFLGAVKAV